MASLLKTNMKINMIFYRRNRLLLIVSLLFLTIMGLTMIPSMLFTSSNLRFRISLQVYDSIIAFLYVVISLVALISIWYHRSHRCLKMIFTKPCPPETWVLSHYGSAFKLFLAGTAIGVVLYVVFSLVWGIPLQAGILASALHHFTNILLTFSALFVLSAWVHPIVAVVIFFVFSESTFYWLTLMCRSGAQSLGDGFNHHLLAILDKMTTAIYYILPTMSPFEDELSKISSSLRVSGSDLKYLGGALVYAVIFSLLAYFLTVYNLRRRAMT